jgi:hypothetical protein
MRVGSLLLCVRAWPRASSIPARHDTAFEHWAIAQLRLYKPHRSIQELSTPSVDTVFSEHLACGGFPNLLQLSTAEETEADSDEVPDNAEDDLLQTAPLETDLVQDDYQVLMDVVRLSCESTQLLGLRGLDLAYPWPTSWNGFPFKTLVSWIGDTKRPCRHTSPLSFRAFITHCPCRVASRLRHALRLCHASPRHVATLVQWKWRRA